MEVINHGLSKAIVFMVLLIGTFALIGKFPRVWVFITDNAACSSIVVIAVIVLVALSS